MQECDVLIVGGGVVGLYLAQACAEKGLNVCVLEKGGDADGVPDTSPPIKFSERRNLAAIEARNHILGGNSRFWGGALVEDDGALVDALGLSGNGRNEFSAASDAVYSKIGIRRTKRLPSPVSAEYKLVLCDFPVLTGKWRNLWAGGREKFSSVGIKCFLNACLVSVQRGEAENLARMKDAAGLETTLRFSSMVVSAGVVDSIRLLARLFPDSVRCGSTFGKQMNDHLSLPVISFPWRRGGAVSQLFPPSFDKSITVGRRLEFELPDSGVKGFIHLQAPYDEVEPYRSLKRLVFARQLGLSAWEILRAAASLCTGGLTTLRVGFDRFFANSLFYPAGGQVNLLVDIESGCETEKSIDLTGDFVLNWSLSEADIARLREASLLALDLFGEEMLDSESLAVTRSKLKSAAFEAYVEKNCEEALHLGGGLQDAVDSTPGCGLRCRLKTDVPVYVMSTAIFPRAGVANPVHTLLVCAEMLSMHLVRP